MYLKVENVSVKYRIGTFKDIGIRDYVIMKLKKQYEVKEFFAVHGVSFEINQGDLLGIVGNNGSGKSTLLKAVAGILEVTEGRIEREGKVVALLELASGFDGELTVKENTFLRGALLGYTEEFMKQKYQEIIEFAELEEFENIPFKQLSSGMKSRLAFAIACLVQPELLILDEVLSVGDGTFRRKSEQKMLEIIRGEVATILVSHSLSQIRRLCNKVLWIEKGEQIAFGPTERICDLYNLYQEKQLLLEECKNIYLKNVLTKNIIQAVYKKYLQRIPSVEELVNALKQEGLTRADLEKQLQENPESQKIKEDKIYQHKKIDEMDVFYLYRCLLGKEPENEEVTQILRKQCTFGELRTQILNSAEFQDKIKNK